MECLIDANFACLRCGIRHRSIAFNSDGDIFIVYLHAAHVFKEEKMKPDARLIALCPRCHFFFDHPRNNDKPDEGIADWAFIGTVVKTIIEEESRQEVA